MYRMAKKRKTSIQKPRKMVGLSVRLHDACRQLARRHRRPVVWQIELMLAESLIKEGIWQEEELDKLLPSDDEEG